jgi:pyridoxal phosphate enzyme (YggS family)
LGSNAEIAGRLTGIRERMDRACARSGRKAADVLLLAVTKVFPALAIREAYEIGLRDFGENYVQEFEGKAPALTGLTGARFHLIGHLQSNKSKKACELFHAVQTIDSAKLARRLDECGKTIEAMIEVKLSHEESKHGADPADLPALVNEIRGCRNVQLKGLMTVPPWSEDPEQSRPYFVRLRELAQQLGLSGLSMGMSNDFEAAIEEGATCVRVGTALFGPRKKA